MKTGLQGAARRGGFSLVELMVVVAIVGILLAVAAYNFAGWAGRYRAESFTRDLQSAIMEARMSAIQTSRAHCLIINSPDTQAHPYGTSYGTYLVKQDMNNEAIEDATLCMDAGDVLLPGYPRPVDSGDATRNIPTTSNRINNLLFVGGAAQVRFTTRGMLVDTNGTMVTSTILKVNYRGECFFAGECASPMNDRSVFPDVDCIVLTPTQVNVGLARIDPTTNQWDGINCDAK